MIYYRTEVWDGSRYIQLEDRLQRSEALEAMADFKRRGRRARLVEVMERVAYTTGEEP